MQSSKIPWTQTSWNPLTGCSEISPGCHNCYARTFSARLAKMGQTKYLNATTPTATGLAWTGHVDLHEPSLNIPATTTSPHVIFVCSMSDLFHPTVTPHIISTIFQIMLTANQHTYLILTKRPAYALSLQNAKIIPPLPNHIWFGVTVENQKNTPRLTTLSKINAHHKFVSAEPMLSQITLSHIPSINWVICGHERGGSLSRIVPLDAIRHLRDQCVFHNIPFFLKQLRLPPPPNSHPTQPKLTSMPYLDGKRWNQSPILPTLHKPPNPYDDTATLNW